MIVFSDMLKKLGEGLFVPFLVKYGFDPESPSLEAHFLRQFREFKAADFPAFLRSYPEHAASYYNKYRGIRARNLKVLTGAEPEANLLGVKMLSLFLAFEDQLKAQGADTSTQAVCNDIARKAIFPESVWRKKAHLVRPGCAFEKDRTL